MIPVPVEKLRYYFKRTNHSKTVLIKKIPNLLEAFLLNNFVYPTWKFHLCAGSFVSNITQKKRFHQLTFSEKHCPYEHEKSTYLEWNEYFIG